MPQNGPTKSKKYPVNSATHRPCSQILYMLMCTSLRSMTGLTEISGRLTRFEVEKLQLLFVGQVVRLNLTSINPMQSLEVVGVSLQWAPMMQPASLQNELNFTCNETSAKFHKHYEHICKDTLMGMSLWEKKHTKKCTGGLHSRVPVTKIPQHGAQHDSATDPT